MTDATSSKLLKTVNVCTTLGRHLLHLSTVCVVGSLAAFGVAVLVDRLHVALEWSDYAEDYDPHDYSFSADRLQQGDAQQ